MAQTPQYATLLAAGLSLGGEVIKGITQVVGERQTNERLQKEQEKLAENEKRTKKVEEEFNQLHLNLKELEMKKRQQESESKSELKRQEETLIYEREKAGLTCEIAAKSLEIERLKEEQQLGAAQLDKEKEKSEELTGKISELYEEKVTLQLENQALTTAGQIQTLQANLDCERQLGSLRLINVCAKERIIGTLNVSLRDCFRLVNSIGGYMEVIPLLQSRIRQKKEGKKRHGTPYLFALLPLVVLFLTLLSSTPLMALLFWSIVSLVAFCILTGYIEWPTNQSNTDMVETKVKELLAEIDNAIRLDTRTPLSGAHDLLPEDCVRSIQDALRERGSMLQTLQTSAQMVSAAMKEGGVLDEEKVTSLEQCFIASQNYLNNYENRAFLLPSTSAMETLDFAAYPKEAQEAIQ